MRVGISIGHSFLSPGAINHHRRAVEFNHAYVVALGLIKQLEKASVLVCFPENTLTLFYPDELTETVECFNRNNVDVALEVHFNSNDNPTARGYGFVYWSEIAQSGERKNSAKGKELCCSLREAAETEHLFPIPAWSSGIKGMDELDYKYFLDRTSAPAVIAEMCFLSNDKDCDYLDTPGARGIMSNILFCGLGKYLSNHLGFTIPKEMRT